MTRPGRGWTRSASPPEPIWVTDDMGVSVSARIYRPACPPRGAVVICGPWGYDATRLQRTRRVLAHGLAACDLLVLDLDHPDTGSSSLDHGRPDALDTWRRALPAGIAWMHAAGVPQPTIVGIGLGALLAADAARDAERVGPLVLWTPARSGSEVARRLRAMSLVTPHSGADIDPHTINVFGHRLHRQVLTGLKQWDPWRSLSPACDVSVVDDAQRPEPDIIAGLLHSVRISARVLQVSGLRPLLDEDAEDGVVPMEAVRVVVREVASRARWAATVIPPTFAESRRLGDDQASGVEEFLRLGPLGPVGVLTSPPKPSDRPAAVLFVNNGVNDASGPARLWVTWSRRLVNDGVMSLRLDLRGLGNSPLPARGRIDRPTALPHESGADVDRAVAQLRAAGARLVILVGLCSGAYIGMANAAYSAAPVDHVVGLNPPLYYPRNVGSGPWNPLTWPSLGWVMHKRRLREAAHRLPRGLHLAADAAYVYPAPDRMLWRASRRVRCDVVLAAADRETLDLRARGRFGFAEPGHHGLVSISHVEGLDHSLFDPAHHESVFAMVRAAALGSPGDSSR